MEETDYLKGYKFGKAEAQAEIDELEILLYEAMKLIPVSKPILNTPTEILNWQSKVLILFERSNKRKYKEKK